jgi:hypothetical protein
MGQDVRDSVHVWCECVCVRRAAGMTRFGECVDRSGPQVLLQAGAQTGTWEATL